MSEAVQAVSRATGQETIDRRAWSRERQLRDGGHRGGCAHLVLAGLLAGRPRSSASTRRGPPSRRAARYLPRYRPAAEDVDIETVIAAWLRQRGMTEGKIAVNGDRATPVFSPYSGRITRVIAGLGDTVKAGAPLATLEASEFVQAQNDLRTAAAQLKLARINETRKHALYDAKGGSLQDWQQAQADLTAAETALQLGAQSPEHSRQVRRGNRRAGASSARSTPSPRSSRRSPAWSWIARWDRASTCRPAAPRRYSPSPIRRACGCSPTCAKPTPARCKLGQSVEVRVPAYPKRVFKARVTYVAPSVDPVTHRLPVRAEIDNRDGALKPEMFASFRILTSECDRSRPPCRESAVVYEGDAAHVWVVAGDGCWPSRRSAPGAAMTAWSRCSRD